MASVVLARPAVRDGQISRYVRTLPVGTQHPEMHVLVLIRWRSVAWRGIGLHVTTPASVACRLVRCIYFRFYSVLYFFKSARDVIACL